MKVEWRFVFYQQRDHQGIDQAFAAWKGQVRRIFFLPLQKSFLPSVLSSFHFLFPFFIRELRLNYFKILVTLLCPSPLSPFLPPCSEGSEPRASHMLSMRLAFELHPSSPMFLYLSSSFCSWVTLSCCVYYTCLPCNEHALAA